MNGKKQFRSLLFHIISRKATAALAIAVVSALTVALAPSAQGQMPATGVGWTEQVLHNFGGSADGVYPYAGLVFDAAGNLYGTTWQGGDLSGNCSPSGCGTVFELTSAAGGGWTETLIQSFNGTDGHSLYSGGSLTFDATGDLYDTTQIGGAFGYGTVFELTPGAGGWNEEVLHSFLPGNSGNDGFGPNPGVVFDAAGNLYGTTAGGGTYNGGTVFELTPRSGGGWTEQVLFSFNGRDEYLPYNLIIDAAGNLYGTSNAGGAYNKGTVFELSPAAGGSWTLKVLYSFSGSPDAAYPAAGLAFDASGNLYGTTYYGGTYDYYGTVFELTPTGGSGWTERVLFSFNGTDGGSPWSSVIVDAAGNVYGTAVGGGAYNNGVVFELTPTAGGNWTYQVLFSFNGTDGGAPYASLILDAAGNLYSTTLVGGTYNYGTVFELSPPHPCATCSHAVLP
jgi:uncharacterized repeat protein (TIGR03803 family)